ncbi:phage tail sheath family protein [Nodosilinea nodulosa]|uniref:phage tail sheath family protein n=1 Tax=Nodosilinea nodulosa TaxID=416001 RepID=UPI0002EA72C2|nr:phage tail sheath subtilisin-like domain-containing protein [Nodosilinea nodulosa]
MPITPTYPGVYIEELPSGVRTITGVATSITAFLGRAKRGPDNAAIVINSYADFGRTFGGLWEESSLGFAVRDFYLNGGSQAIVVRLHNGATAATLDLPTGAAAPNDFLQLEAASVGGWGANLRATVNYDTKDPANLFNLVVFEADSATGALLGAPEAFLNVSIDPNNPRYLPIVLEQQSQLVRVIRDLSGDWVVPNVRPSVTPTGPDVPVVATGGGDGSALSALEFDDPADPTMRDDKRGLYALEQADLFNLLCIPPYLTTGDVDTDVVTAAAVYCETRRAMLLIDPPSDWTSKTVARSEIQDPVANLGTQSKNAAVFFPRIRQANPLRENQLEEFVPCGVVAGIFARTDAQRGVWKAPAGLEATLTGVTALSVNLTDAENGELNPLGVNCLRSFPGVGRVIWGSRTLQGSDRLASEWKYIPVRRLALFLEESLYRGTQWVVFEPNDEPLWAQIRLNIGAFMNNLFRQGAFQGRTPREAYFVKCDRETTTQNDIDRGIVNIVVGFAPLKPAEFVIIKFQQIAGNIAT